MKKNDIYEIVIEDIGNDGEGIGHIYEGETEAGMTIFVKDTVVGDEIKVRIVKVKKRYAYGRLEEILKPSPYRVDAVCPKARQCGGCALMHMDYQKQLDYKWNKVKNCLERIGGIEDAGALMEPVCGMDNPYHYRNKMQFPVSITLKFCTFFTPKKCTDTTDVSLRVNHLFPLSGNFPQLSLQLLNDEESCQVLQPISYYPEIYPAILQSSYLL